ncbi:hypothetical protein [Teredinibacter purpureus]|uniref:hypothetical protein n=1 Tax=Teredinibacter purpureus TaxID=2731756 RepID=UPI0005F8937E|nr:hypothetical protein [Teredinibacter purpureus]
MVGFNDLTALGSRQAFGLLGAVLGVYRRGAKVVHGNAQAVIDLDFITPAENGMGVVSQIRAVFLVAEVGAVKVDDEYIQAGQRYRIAALDGNDGIEAAAFVRKY